MTVMNLALAAQCLDHYIQEGISCFIWGPPGVGKSDMVNQVGAKRNMTVIEFILSLRDAVDLRGLPAPDLKSGVTRWLFPNELPQVKRDGEKGILFIDEANRANKSMQDAAMGLVLTGRLGEYTLPPGWTCVAAGNRMVDKAAVEKMGTALRNRFAHIEVGVDLDAWRAWASSVDLHPLVHAFIGYRPELLHVMPSGDENSFPTPRAWAKVAKLADAPEAIRQHLVSGLVGDGPASEFEAFARVWSRMQSIPDILRDPKSVRVPPMDEPAMYYALVSALARRSTRENFANVLTYAAKLPKEFSVLLIVDAVKRQPKLKQTGAFTQWAVANQDVVI